MQKSASRARESLLESQQRRVEGYDVFLSHSSRDALEVLELKEAIEAHSCTVYVDWVDDAGALSRDNVTVATANHLRARLSTARSLLVHATGNAAQSRWVPWELGVADGAGLPVAVVPVVMAENQSAYRGAEYYGLYPWIDRAPDAKSKRDQLWVNHLDGTHRSFVSWIRAARER